MRNIYVYIYTYKHRDIKFSAPKGITLKDEKKCITFFINVTNNWEQGKKLIQAKLIFQFNKHLLAHLCNIWNSINNHIVNRSDKSMWGYSNMDLWDIYLDKKTLKKGNMTLTICNNFHFLVKDAKYNEPFYMIKTMILNILPRSLAWSNKQGMISKLW